jgi:hypothetical protein
MSDTPISDSTPHNVADLGMLCMNLERELNAANDRIKRLEEAGDEMYKFINPPSPCMRSTRMDNLLQGWDDAKININ